MQSLSIGSGFIALALAYNPLCTQNPHVASILECIKSPWLLDTCNICDLKVGFQSKKKHPKVLFV